MEPTAARKLYEEGRQRAKECGSEALSLPRVMDDERERVPYLKGVAAAFREMADKADNALYDAERNAERLVSIREAFAA